MNKFSLVLAAFAIILAGYSAFHAYETPMVGAINGGSTSFSNLVLQTDTGATSTLQVGCIQALASSSATTIKLVFSTLGATSTFPGTAYWQYGTCP